MDDPDGNNEGYKWRAVSCFMENWDIDADDFASMFKSSMKDTSNLIDNATVQPIGGILLLLKHPEEIEFVRKCFRDLYTDDGGNLEARQEKSTALSSKSTLGLIDMQLEVGNIRRNSTMFCTI